MVRAGFCASKDDGQGEKPTELLSINRTIYGLAFHPDYQKNGYLFLGSNGPVKADDQDIPGQRFKPDVVKMTRISRFTVQREAPYACDPNSEKLIIEWASNGHNGGDLAFGPDGMLYISSGDGTSDSDTDVTGQDLDLLLAKSSASTWTTLRRANLWLPADNPFLKTPGPGDLGVRLPQPLAAAHRPDDRRHLGRQQRPGLVGADLFVERVPTMAGASSRAGTLSTSSVRPARRPFPDRLPSIPTPRPARSPAVWFIAAKSYPNS